MVSWQGTDGPGRGIGSVPSEALAPACSGLGIEAVMMDRILGGPPQTQIEAAGRERCPETGVEKPKRRVGQRLRKRVRDTERRERSREKGRDPERRERDPESQGENKTGAETPQVWGTGQKPRNRGQKHRRENIDAQTQSVERKTEELRRDKLGM